jgi:hypothetical protein
MPIFLQNDMQCISPVKDRDTTADHVHRHSQGPVRWKGSLAIKAASLTGSLAQPERQQALATTVTMPESHRKVYEEEGFG